MRLRIFASVILLSATAAGLWSMYGTDRLPFGPGQAGKPAAAQQPAKPAYVIPASTYVPRNRAEQRYLASTDRAALLREIEGQRDVDSMYLRALIIDYCSIVHPSRQKESVEEQLKNFRGTTFGPYKEQRIALLEHHLRNGAVTKCAKFTQPLTTKDVDDAYDEAADAGSLHGGVDRIRRRLLARALPDNTHTVIGTPPEIVGLQFYQGPGPTPEEAALLMRALASREPSLLREAGMVLFAKYTDYEIRLPDGKGIELVSVGTVWNAVACHYEGGCGPESWGTQQGCIYQSRCDVSNYMENLQRYGLKEDQYKALLYYRDMLIRILDSGDLSQLNEARGKPQNFWRHQLPLATQPRFRLQH